MHARALAGGRWGMGGEEEPGCSRALTPAPALAGEAAPGLRLAVLCAKGQQDHQFFPFPAPKGIHKS